MSTHQVDLHSPLGDADARVWRLTSAIAVVAAVPNGWLRSPYSPATAGLPIIIAVLAAGQGRVRTHGRPATTLVAAIVGGLLAGAAVLSITAILSAWRQPSPTRVMLR